jgi:hypothetical protein
MQNTKVLRKTYKLLGLVFKKKYINYTKNKNMKI